MLAKKTVLPLLALCLAFTAHPQSFREIIKVYGNSGNAADVEFPGKMIRSADGHFIVPGLWRDSCFLMKLTLNGDTVWLRKYKYGAQAMLRSVAQLPDGSLVAVGYCLDTKTSPAKILVLKTTADGQAPQPFVYGYVGQPAEARSVIVTATGEIVVTGFITNPAGTRKNALFLKLNTLLGIVINKEIGGADDEEANCVIQLANGNFILAGQTSVFANNRIDNYAWLARIGANGSTSWTKRSAFPFSAFSTVLQTGTGEITAAGYRYKDVLQQQDAYLVTSPLTAGGFTREETFGSTSPDVIEELAPVQGGLLACGFYGTPGCSPGSKGRAWVMRLDNTFSITENYFWEDSLYIFGPAGIIANSFDAQDFSLTGYRIQLISPSVITADIQYLRRINAARTAMPGAIPVPTASPCGGDTLITQKQTISVKNDYSTVVLNLPAGAYPPDGNAQ